MDKRIEITARQTGAKETHVVQAKDAVVDVRNGAAVKVVAGREELSAMAREGDDLILRFADGTAVRLDGYFACPAEDVAELIYVDAASGAQWRTDLDSAACFAADDTSAQALAYSFEPIAASSGIGSGLLVGLGALAAGGIAAAAGGGGGRSDSPASPVDRDPPAAPTVAPSNGTALTGTAEAGSTVRIDVNGDGTIDATVTAASDGKWSYTPPTRLTDGTAVSVTASDAAGNVSPATRVTVDAAAPAAPTVEPTNGATLAGTAEAGATVNLDLDGDGDVDATTTANGSGNWSYTPSTPIPNGTTVIVTATDAVGNTSPPSTVTVDAVAPAAPAVNPSNGSVVEGTAEPGSTVGIDADGDGDVDATVPVDAGGNWSYTPPTPIPDGTTIEVIATDPSGNESPPTTAVVDAIAPAAPTIDPTNGTGLSGTAEAGSTINLDLDGDGDDDATTTADGSGNWSYTPSTPIPDSTTVNATATDAAGNESGPATVTVDAAAPSAPAIGTIADDVDTVLGTVVNGGSTNDTLPAISGTAEAGATISVYDNGALLGTATADGMGGWSFTPSSALAEGSHSFTATATDSVGNMSATSAAYAVTVDTTAPAAPVLAPTDGTTVSGTAEAGAIIALDTNGDGNADATTAADGAGNWSITLTTPLAEGTVVTATATDAAGNASAPGAATVDTAIDTTPPAVPVIGGVADDVGATQGSVANGGTTDDAQPAIAGSGVEAGATVSIYDNGVLLGTTTADGSGNWSFTPPAALADGHHDLTATATDAAGNESAASAPHAITVDTAVPAVPVISTVADDVDAVRGTVANGGSTNDTLPAISGTGEAGATISIFDNGTQLGTATVDALGNWSFTPPAALGEGSHSFTATATDGAGHTSTTSAGYSVIVDVTVPAAPVIAPSDGTTISGTAEAGAVINLDLDGDGTPDAVVTADGSGAWSYTASPAIPDGMIVSATATDAAGNISGPATTTIDTSIDATPPAAPVIDSLTDDVDAVVGSIANGGSTNDALPVIAGAGAEAGSTVSVYDNGALLGTTTADGSGNWSFTPTAALLEGSHSFTATATDGAGNESAASAAYAVTVDTTVPAAPVVNPTNGAELSGTAEAGSTVNLDLDGDGDVDATTLVDGSGNWSYVPATPIPDGTTVTATATDAAGNSSGPASTVVDAVAPAAPVISSVADDVGAVLGVVVNGGSTDDALPAISGTAEAGATVSVYDNGTLLGTAAADGSGNWSFTPPTALGEGAHSFTATATDAAGNISTGSPAYGMTVDLTQPTAPSINGVTDDVGPVVGLIPDGGATDDTMPLIAGTGAEANSTVSVYDNGVLLGATLADGVGNWAFTPATPLGEGTHIFTATSSDAAGNESGVLAPHTIVIDTTAPVATVAITAIADDTGTQGDWSTEDSSPTILGTLSAALESGEAVQVSLDGGTTWTDATVNGTNWFFGPGVLSPGNYALDVRVIDAAGNVGDTASQAITVTTDVNQAPFVQVSETDLLGIVSAETLGLLDLDETSLVALDPDGNLQSVVINYAPLLSLNLGAFTLAASQELAAELGLTIEVVNDPGILGIIAPSSTMTITALDGGTIDNVAINELLRTVHFEQNVTLIGLDVLNSTTITATDSEGLSATDGVGNLLDLTLLDVNGDPTVIEGTAGDNVLAGTADDERLYGYDGNDTLSGGGGNDLLRGGAGADTLDGGAGNDVLIYDAADTLIDGGDGTDALLIDSGTGLVLTLDGTTNLANIERIDLGTGNAGRGIILTEAGLLQATGSDHQLIITGDDSDSVTMTGATYQGQALVDGHAYDQYSLGTTTVLVEDPVMVVA